MVFIFLYIGICAILGYLGRDYKFRFGGYFICSLIFTPLVGILLILASDKRRRVPVAAKTTEHR